MDLVALGLNGWERKRETLSTAELCAIFIPVAIAVVAVLFFVIWLRRRALLRRASRWPFQPGRVNLDGLHGKRIGELSRPPPTYSECNKRRPTLEDAVSDTPLEGKVTEAESSKESKRGQTRESFLSEILFTQKGGK